MFDKIKGKLKNVFKKSEDVVEENPDEIVEEEVPQKKGFFKRMFTKDEEEEVEPKKKSKSKKKDKKSDKKSDKKKTKEDKKEKKSKSKETKKEKKSKKKDKKSKKKEEIEEDVQEVEVEEESKSEDKEDVKVEEETNKEEKKGFFSKLFKKKEEAKEVEKEELTVEEEVIEQEKKDDEKQEESGFISRTFQKISKKTITDEDFERIWVELEIFLLEINIAYEIVEKIRDALKEQLIGNSFSRFKLSEKIREVLVEKVSGILKDREADFIKAVKDIKKESKPVKVLILGVNGTGKTTTIAKIVAYLRKEKLTTVVAAADTFRAAAMEQLEEHSKKLDFKLIRHKGGSDPAAVAFDAIEHAKAKGLDVVLIDTAGRMPNNTNLMAELQKIKKVSGAQLTVFIGDSISGNDLIDQIELFNKGLGIDGVILTKVDTDDKPGSVVTTAYAIERPIYFLGTGQKYEDLIAFDSKYIAEQLFAIEDDENEEE